MGNSPRSFSTNRSWRQQTTMSQGAESKFLPRLFLSAVGLILCGVLVYLLWWWLSKPSVYYASLPIVDYGPLAVPPIPFSIEDSKEFLLLGSSKRILDLRNLETFKGINTLSNLLQATATHSKDVLLFWITAHGVSDNGVAYLLCSDYLREATEGRYPLSDLLQKIHQSSAGLKLVILDANHLPADPRLGMLVNEFPWLLEEEVKKLEAPDLWVLSAAGPMQDSHSSSTLRRSVFGAAVTEGLRGDADQDHNGKVDLAELFSFTENRVLEWARQNTGSPSQQPCLLRGDEGLVNTPEKKDLAPISGRRPPPSEDRAPDQTDILSLLQKAWELRDRRQDRTLPENEGWSPVDYAPQDWREFQALLLGYELQYRSGAAFPGEELDPDLQRNVLAPSAGKKSVINRLAEARRLFWDSDAKRRFERPETAALKQALQLKNDLLFRAPYYVRWQANVSRYASQPHRLYPSILQLMEKLQAFCQQFDAWPEALSDTAASDARADWLQKIERMRTDLESLRDSLERDLCDQETQQKSAESIEALLDTPLLPASRHMVLLKSRETLDQPPPAPGEAAVGTEIPASPLSRKWFWDRLFFQAKLEVQLANLAEPTENFNLPELSASIAGAQDDSSMRLAYRKLGRKLGKFYQDLPARINEAVASSEPENLRRVERWLRAVDARDAAQINADANAKAVPLLPEVRPPLHLDVLVKEKDVLIKENLRINQEQGTPFEIEIRTSDPAASSASVVLQFDDQLIRITNRVNQRTLLPGEEFPVDLKEPLRLLARARVKSDFSTSLELKVTCENQPKVRRITVEPAPPERVDLTVLEFGRPIETQNITGDQLHLHPFPNRTTAYQFELINRSERARKATVEFLALPESPPDRRRNERESPLDSLENVKLGIVRLTEPVEVSLPADTKPTPIPSPRPDAAAAQGKEEKTEPKPKPADGAGPPPAAEKTGKPVTYGMACVIRDAQTSKVLGLKWIDFTPLSPKRYLQPEVSYELQRGQITIRVTADESLGLPPLSPQTPLSVVWSNADQCAPQTARNDRVQLTAVGQSALLFAKVENKKVEVQLAVDEYPRAFIYQVDCNQDQLHIRDERNLKSIRITKPAAGEAFRVPLAKPLQVEFQVDAPDDSFRNPDDMVQVAILREDSDPDHERLPEIRRRFYADRQMEVFFQEVNPAGEMQIKTKVSDFSLLLNTGGLSAKVRVLAQLLLANPRDPENRISEQDAVPIILDSSPPTLRFEALRTPVRQGSLLTGKVHAEDELSGIKEVRIGIDRDDSGALEDAEKPKKLLPPGMDGTWDFSLPTQDLEPGNYTLIATAVDQVDLKTERKETVVISPSPFTPPQPTATSGTIIGQVILQGGGPLPRIQVSLQGTRFTTTTDDNGAFSFKDVPAGKYTILAQGSVLGGSQRSVTKELTFTPTEEPLKVDLKMEW
jgi:hypothetical protein